MLEITAAILCLLGALFVPFVLWMGKRDPQAPSGGSRRKEIFTATLSFKAGDGMFWMWLNDGSITYISSEQNEQLGRWSKEKKTIKEIRAHAQANF